METIVLKVDRKQPERDKLRRAADVLRSGGLVAFPTETVYGLGANALDEKAAAGIYQAKGRPSDNPLIVHIADKDQVTSLVREVPAAACKLMDAFWPGPLTLIMLKKPVIPLAITAGLDTVALRMPSHPVARALIREAGLPVAAPSANVSGKPSTTSAAHVIHDLWGKVDVIIDAGSAEVGLESTVLDVTVNPSLILRPGGVTQEQIDKVLGSVSVDPALLATLGEDTVPRSPGMKYAHYSPEAEVIIVEGEEKPVVEYINCKCLEYRQKGIKVGVMAATGTGSLYKNAEVLMVGNREKPETIAAGLFETLRQFDLLGVRVVLAEAFEESGIGMAVMNRLYKAAAGKVVRV